MMTAALSTKRAGRFKACISDYQLPSGVDGHRQRINVQGLRLDECGLIPLRSKWSKFTRSVNLLKNSDLHLLLGVNLLLSVGLNLLLGVNLLLGLNENLLHGLNGFTPWSK